MNTELEEFATIETSVGTVAIRLRFHRAHALVLLDNLALPPEDWRKVAAALCGAADYAEQRRRRELGGDP